MLSRLLTRFRREPDLAAYQDPVALVTDHFKLRGLQKHLNFTSLRDLLVLMGGRPQTILETGMSAWGPDSTRLFDAYVQSFGGRLWSVDVRPEPIERLTPLVGRATTLVCDDSVAFLGQWVEEHPGEHADVVYLDSWDVDFDAPLPAANHCLREIEAITPGLRSGTLLLIDDSPGAIEDIPGEATEVYREYHSAYGAWPGKGMLAQQVLLERGAELVHHRYQALYRI